MKKKTIKMVPTHAIVDQSSHSQLHWKALTDYWAFIELIQYRGGTKSFGEVHHDLVNFLMDKTRPRKMVLMPRGHLKSTLGSVGLALWRIYQNPNVRILVGTASKPLALAFVREVKQYLEDPELMERVWNNRPHIKGPLIPQLDGSIGTVQKSMRKRNRGDDDNFDEGYTEAADKKVVWKQDALQVNRTSIMKEPTLVATSVNSPDTGFHYDLFIGDDIVTFQNSDTEAKRERILGWLADQESVIDPYNPTTHLGGEFLLIGTRYFFRDAYGIYSNQDLTEDELEELREDVGDSWNNDEFAVFSRNIYVNGKDDTDGYLWPERFNAKVIQSIRRRMNKQPNGERRFASQYLNMVYSGSGAQLDSSKMRAVGELQVDRERGVVRCNLDGQVVEFRPTLAIDPAISMSSRADRTAIAVVGSTSDHRVIVMDLVCGKLTPNETVEEAYRLLTHYGLRVAWVDSEKLGQALKYTFQTASTHKDFPVVVKDHKYRGNKEDRLRNRFEPLLTNGLMYAAPSVRNNVELKTEIDFFGQSGVHDDCLDSIDAAIDHSLPAMTNSDQTRLGRHPSSRAAHYIGVTLDSMRRAQQQRTTYNARYGGIR